MVILGDMDSLNEDSAQLSAKNSWAPHILIQLHNTVLHNIKNHNQ